MQFNSSDVLLKHWSFVKKIFKGSRSQTSFLRDNVQCTFTESEMGPLWSNWRSCQTNNEKELKKKQSKEDIIWSKT